MIACFSSQLCVFLEKAHTRPIKLGLNSVDCVYSGPEPLAGFRRKHCICLCLCYEEKYFWVKGGFVFSLKYKNTPHGHFQELEMVHRGRAFQRILCHVLTPHTC